MTVEEFAAGVVRVVNATMEKAVRATGADVFPVYAYGMRLLAVVHVAVFSLMTGIVHPYYAVALAPAIAAGIAAMCTAMLRLPLTSTLLAIRRRAGVLDDWRWSHVALDPVPQEQLQQMENLSPTQKAAALVRARRLATLGARPAAVGLERLGHRAQHRGVGRHRRRIAPSQPSRVEPGLLRMAAQAGAHEHRVREHGPRRFIVLIGVPGSRPAPG